jgi:hypothetical protein
LCVLLIASCFKCREDASAAVREPADACLLAAGWGNQLHRVNAPELAEPIHASDALLHARGCPGDFEVHHKPASVLEVQSFAGRVGRKEEAAFDLVELTQRSAPFRACQSAMQLQRVEAGQDLSETSQRVAVLGKHKGGLVCAPEEALKCLKLALALRRVAGKRQETVEPPPLIFRISQPGDAELGSRLVIIVRKREWQPQLFPI